MVCCRLLAGRVIGRLLRTDRSAIHGAGCLRERKSRASPLGRRGQVVSRHRFRKLTFALLAMNGSTSIGVDAVVARSQSGRSVAATFRLLPIECGSGIARYLADRRVDFAGCREAEANDK